jgi:hypothetical protein
LQAKERLEQASREASAIEERARAEAALIEADSASRGRHAVEEAERRAQETIDAARHEAAIRIAAAQRESSDIRAELEAEHTELLERVRSLQTAVVGMLEHGAARSPDIASVLEPMDDEFSGSTSRAPMDTESPPALEPLPRTADVDEVPTAEAG